jgi:hypothetical protein
MKTVIPVTVIHGCDVVRVEKRVGRVRIVFADDSEIAVFAADLDRPTVEVTDVEDKADE